MALGARSIAAVLGGLLLAFGAQSLVGGWVNHHPWPPLLLGSVTVWIPGVILLGWAVRRPGPSAAPSPPSSFWTVVMLTVGTLVVLYGLLLGAIEALVFGAVQGVVGFLVPWGAVGFVLISLGVGRAASRSRSAWATDRARALLQPAPSEIPLPPAAEGGIDPRVLQSVQAEIGRTVQSVYRATAPPIRLALWVWLVSWLASVAVLLLVVLRSLGAGGPIGALPPLVLTPGLLVLSLVFLPLGILEVGVGVPARLRELRRAESELESGRVPELYELVWWLPFVYTLRTLAPSLGYPVARASEGGSVLETSYGLLRFGRWLSYYARYWYTSVFVLLLLASFVAFLGGALVGFELLHGPVGESLGWAAMLAVMIGAFAYLSGRYRELDRLSDRLAILQAAEAELARAFWSRF